MFATGRMIQQGQSSSAPDVDAPREPFYVFVVIFLVLLIPGLTIFRA
jgi:hypothetical protein